MLTSCVVLFLACAAFVTNDTLTFRQELVESVAVLAEAVGNNCAAAIDFNDPKTATETLDALHANDNIISACVYTRDGLVFAVYRRDATSSFVPPPVHFASHEFSHGELHLFRSVKQRGDVVGTIFVASNLNNLSTRLNRYLGIVVFVFLASMFIALLLSSRLQRLVSDPILNLARVARTVAQDKNYSLRAVRQSNDEIGQLVNGFNEMLAQIQQREAALQSARGDLERCVEERTAELAESQSLYHSLVEQMPAGVFRKDAEGRYVFVNPWFCRIKGATAEQLLGKTPAELAHDELAEQRAKHPEEIQFMILGASHHELIMKNGRPLELEEEYSDTEGKRVHLRVVKSAVFGPGEKIIGTQGILYDVTGRKQADAALAQERNLLRTMINNLPEAIYIKDLSGRKILANPAELKNMGCKTEAEAVGKSDFDIYPQELAAGYFADDQAVIRSGQPLINREEKVITPSGETHWVLSSKIPLRDAAGNIIGLVGVGRDITAIKEAEAKLEQAHKQLLETSRQAGMAEIATNVLHNIGNVLNSVNVSASVVADGVKKSKASSLVKVVALLGEHEQDLGTFFARDPRGKQLPGYLAQLAEHFLTDQKAMLKELDLLRGNIDHIKQIVAMQQSYAKVSGLKEIINLNELVDDCLRMNDGAFSRHQVEIIREFEAVPPLNVEKHKILQILVNLLRNAKLACQESERTDRRLTVRVAQNNDQVKISVSDNGVGIPPENLTRIFNHGFTTRKEGHGFGLHSGALAAREMGGTLSVHSDGPGRGATFTLELPCEALKLPIPPAPGLVINTSE